MQVDFVRFVVRDAIALAHQFTTVWGFRAIATPVGAPAGSRAVANGSIRLVFSAPQHPTDAATQHLRRHPPGVVDLAWRVPDLDRALVRALAAGAKLQRSPHPTDPIPWATITGWGTLNHTLVADNGRADVTGTAALTNAADMTGGVTLTGAAAPGSESRPAVFGASQRQSGPDARALERDHPGCWRAIDHAVLNVPAGELERAVAWYEQVFGFTQGQRFTIITPHSGLRSQVLIHPHGGAQLPINEPTTVNSQIQTFLDHNGGAGVQHLALETADIVATVGALRRGGVKFLPVPATYYAQLGDRLPPALRSRDWSALAHHGILIDWQGDRPQAPLLQIFTAPLFPEPTFFFEVIQRQPHDPGDRAEGFGEGNFRALFEAIEREQMSHP